MNVRITVITLLCGAAILILAGLLKTESAEKSVGNNRESATDLAKEIAQRNKEYIRDCRGNSACLRANPYKAYSFK